MTRKALVLVALAGLVAIARPASAQICVAVDTSKDNLGEPERKAAVTLVSQAFADSGQQVIAAPCPQTVYVHHVRFGNSVTVYLASPRGSRTATARTLEDVPYLYSQMVKSLVTGQPMSGANDTVDRTNVTTAQMASNRVEADSLWYIRLGYGSILGASSGGPAVGFGYRYELDNIGIDASFLNFVLPPDDGNTDFDASGSLIKLMGLYFVNPTANRTLYLGAGVAYGSSGLTEEADTYTGSGLQGELSLGYEILRASSIRMFMQLDASLPFYSVQSTQFTTLGSTTDSKWAPTFALSLGVGWGRSRVLTVRNIY